MTTLTTLAIQNEQDVVKACHQVRELATQLEFNPQNRVQIATVVAAIAHSVAQSHQGGTVDLAIIGNPQTLQIQFQCQDQLDLSAAIAGQDASESAARTIAAARRLMDAFAIKASPAQGTLVVLGKILPQPLTIEELQQLQATGLARSPHPHPEPYPQNQELLQALIELQAYENSVAQLNQELKETNRGVVALYTELDEKAQSLRRANELKTRFLSNMSHEFRTPLNSISALSQMLLTRRDGDLTPDQEKQISFIAKATTDLTALVNDLLDLAKVEAGKTEMRLSAFEVESLFGMLRGMMRPLLVQDSEVKLIIEPSGEVSPLYTDESKVAQILRNFISNALKFTPQGEVRVTAMQAGSMITFTVADTGIGIAPELQERIFEDFVQIESPIQTQVKGTGLGLPLSRKLAELLGGSVAVSSQPSQGSTFAVSIPIIHPNATELTSATPPVPSLNSTLLPVLVVEDDAATMSAYAEHLQGSRYQLITAYTLKQARTAMQRLQPAVIALDILVDGHSGWTLLQEIKGQPTTTTIPVLVITVVDNEAQAVALGADGFLVKPVSRVALLNKLNALFNQDQPQKILLMEDDEAYRYLIKEKLKTSPLQVLEATSSQEGLTMAEREQPNAIMLNSKLLGLDILDAVEQLKANTAIQTIPMIVYTSAQLNNDVRKHLAQRNVILLPKGDTSQTNAIVHLQNALLNAGFVLDV